MPPQIETAIKKLINDFLWDDGQGPRIALDTLCQPEESGGLNILDMHARNEAIELMWLKEFLNFSPSRQPWATVTDLIIDAAAPKSTTKAARSNPFLQCWDTPTRGPRLAALKLSVRLRQELPACTTWMTNWLPLAPDPPNAY